MITWTTYGTWLQGDAKGFVTKGKIREANIALKKSNIGNLKEATVRLGQRERDIVRDAILGAAKRFQQKIHAIAVHSNHVHIVAEYVEVPMGVLVGCYKSASRIALKNYGFEGKVWTRGYDKRFCYDAAALRSRINYVQRHK